MPPKIVETNLRVRYAETDAQGVVYHANYLVYFEVARGTFLRELGVDYRALEESGFFVVVVEAQTRYLASARYDDELTVLSWVSELGNRSFSVSYEVHREGVKLTEGRTAHVCVNREGRPVTMPSHLVEALRAEA